MGLWFAFGAEGRWQASAGGLNAEEVIRAGAFISGGGECQRPVDVGKERLCVIKSAGEPNLRLSRTFDDAQFRKAQTSNGLPRFHLNLTEARKPLHRRS